MKKIRLAVIFGGKSGEHEVSICSAASVFEALDKNKYEIMPVAITKEGKWLFGKKGQEYFEKNVDAAKKEGGVEKNQFQDYPGDSIEKLKEEKVDLVLPILHGPFGEDGKLQGLLDVLGVPYVFSGVLAHALAMNKPKTKIIAKNAGLDVAESVVLKSEDELSVKEVVEKLGLPIVVKPAELGSSVGMTLAQSEEELEEGITRGQKVSREILLEKYVKGRELTVSILETGGKVEVLPVIEIIPKKSQWFDYQAKYEPGATEEVCPAQIPKEIEQKVQKHAKDIFEEIGCKDLARADFIWSEADDKLYFLEINTIPGMTKTSLVPQSAKVFGLEFGKLLDVLIENNLK